jgi:outer membrane protein TolC
MWLRIDSSLAWTFFANASLSDSNDSINQYASFDSDNVRTSMGFELDIPINRFSERNQYRTTLINFERALRNLGLALDNKRNAIRLALRNLKQYEQNYEIQKISMELASKRVTGASLTYQAGRATVDQIVRAQDNLVAARNALSTTMVNYIGARMNLLLEIGILRTDREDFWISQDAVVVDLKSEQLLPRGESIAPTENNPQLLKTPDQLFQ